MKFDELDRQMRVFETAHDHCVLPGLYMVARLDGRNFSRLTTRSREDGGLGLEAPFDPRLRDWMLGTVEHLMGCGIRALYGYTESDELSLLLHPAEAAFGRKLRKLNSVLAGEASASFSLMTGTHGVFDCRISQLPTIDDVVDYFRWRAGDSQRNALNAWCQATLRRDGQSTKAAAAALSGLTGSEKRRLLARRGVSFGDLPPWQKRGSGVFWTQVEVTGHNPTTGAAVKATRRRLQRDLELPVGEAYGAYVRRLMTEGG